MPILLGVQDSIDLKELYAVIDLKHHGSVNMTVFVEETSLYMATVTSEPQMVTKVHMLIIIDNVQIFTTSHDSLIVLLYQR